MEDVVEDVLVVLVVVVVGAVVVYRDRELENGD